MGASVRSVASANEPGYGGSVTVSSPSGSTTGDVLVALVMATDGSADIATPSGWTLLAAGRHGSTSHYYRWFYRSWVSGSHTFTATSACMAAHVAAVQGGTTTGMASSLEGEGSSTSPSSPTVTATEGACLLVGIGWDIVHNDYLSITYPSGMTSRGTTQEFYADYGGGYGAYVGSSLASSDNVSAGETGSKSWTVGASGDWLGFSAIVPAGSTTHTASASASVTATLAAAATPERVCEVTASHTATLTAAAALERAAAVTAATTATLAAEARVERDAAAALSVTASTSAAAAGTVDAEASLTATATLTAAADVSTPGVVTMDVALAVTGSTSAAAALDASVAGMLAATASFAAEASTATVHEAQASRAVTAAINAAAAVLVGGVGDPGSMTLADIARATMTPTGSAGATMRTVLVGFNAATMQAVLDDSASAPLLGVPVFVGDDDPVTLGLVTLTTAHVWFHDGTVTVREG